ncbi:MAG TPA: ABC transporter substrate-binding protein [Xanthobacteraceae bacterium]|nr:ABC transporter substrate-binding protein [Xanthobacteraceae bacterium]
MQRPVPPRRSFTAGLLVALGLILTMGTAAAQTKTVRVAKQFGISYLPLTLIEDKKLIEAHARRLGLEVKTEWVQLTSGTPMNEALISGSVDFVSGGVGPLLSIWGKTRENFAVKAVAALNAMPLYLTSINPSVKSIKDFTDRDRIALPALRVSIQAITLQMAAESAFGPGQQYRLDPLTVSLSHPDGLAQLLSGRSEITAHFTSAPFMYQELADPRVRKILDSYEVLGGPHTFNLVWTTGKFHAENPKLVEAFIAALDEAMQSIARDPAAAAAIWVRAENSKLSADYIEKLIRLPENEWTMVPKKIMAYAEFMSRAGMLPVKPASWRDMFFSDAYRLPGS